MIGEKYTSKEIEREIIKYNIDLASHNISDLCAKNRSNEIMRLKNE